MPASDVPPPNRDFLSMAVTLGLLSPQQLEQLTAETAARQLLPSQLALQKGLLTVAQIDIVETLLRPTETIPGYEILSTLGQGGMGVVYRARQLNLQRIVAIKTVLVTRMGDERALQRFQHEAQAVARLAHPHIIAAFDFGHCNGRWYFVMEMVEGEDLESRIARHGPLSEKTTWGLVRQAAAGLAHAAQHRLVHRDIKPANLLLLEPPAGFPLPAGLPLLKIADFGLVRLAAAADEAARLTSVGMAIGSPHYMPPEQLRGEPVDERADIFALGASAFHMLCGEPPLADKSLSQIIAHRLSGLSESVRAVRAEVTHRSDDLIAAMMASDPERRIADYGGLIRRIDAVLQLHAPAAPDARTISFVPDTGVARTMPMTAVTQPIRTRPWSKHLNQLSIAVGGLAALLILLGTIGRRAPPIERDLVESGHTEELFNGRNINQWRTVAGGWNPAKNSEGAIVLQGHGMVRRPLIGQDAAAKPRPLTNYRLTFVVDLHEASAVELQFDSSANDVDNKCRLVRIDRERSAFGQRTGERDPPRLDASLPHASHGVNALHAIQLERQSHGWWVFVDERYLASAALDHATPAHDFGLLAEGGPAWFSDFTVEELVPANAR